MSAPSAQVELCHAYASCIATKDWERFPTILHPDVVLVFLPKSFGAPGINGANEFMKVVKHVMSTASDLSYELKDVIEDEGRVWFYVRLQLEDHVSDSEMLYTGSLQRQERLRRAV
jgi:hypothetical protein